jgi:hypothetical protein
VRTLLADYLNLQGTIIHGHKIITPLATLLHIPSSKYTYMQSPLLEQSINLVPYCKTSINTVLLSALGQICGDILTSKKVFSAVLSALPAFDMNLTQLSGIITRLAFSDNSTSTQAVLQSLLALATFYRTGDRQQTTELTVAALKSLRLSAQSGLSRDMSLQHIVASMLICSVEVFP